MAQTFIYIGYQSHVRFMVRHSNAESDEIRCNTCCQVYNTWIHMDALNPGDNMIIFNIEPTGTYPVLIYHASMDSIQISKEQLQEALRKMIDANREDDDMVIITSDRNQTAYHFFVVDSSSELIATIKRIHPGEMHDIARVMTIKPLKNASESVGDVDGGVGGDGGVVVSAKSTPINFAYEHT